jgi:hypothetical protein
MKQLCVLGVFATVLASAGCASIVTGQSQSLSVEARDAASPVVGANCKLTNDKGTWFVVTPGSAMVQRSYGDLSVQCEKQGMAPGILTTKSMTKGMAFGNILFGGIIGAGVDVATGAAYDYPSLITVHMGKTTRLEPPPSQTEVAPQADATPR